VVVVALNTSKKIMTFASSLAILSIVLMILIQFTDGLIRDTLGVIALVCLLSFFPLIEIGSIKRIKEKLKLKPILTLAVANFFPMVYLLLGFLYNGSTSCLNFSTLDCSS